VRQAGGRYGGASEAPAVPLDTDVLAEEDLNRYVAALERCWTNAAGGDLSGLGPFETLAVQVAQA
jgi:hypothetical protein